MNRRTLLAGIGGAMALAGIGGAYKVFSNHDAALAPWRDAMTPKDDVRLHAFSHAILAPSPHNRQPWLIRLDGLDGATLSCDLDRRLPETDPFDRQITIGFGCFIAIAEIAAAARGHRMGVELFPEGEPGERLDARPIARLRFVADPTVGRDPLYAEIQKRRSVKRPFDMAKAVSPELLGQFRGTSEANASLAATAATNEVEDIRALAWEAWLIEARTRRTWQESVDLMRIGTNEIVANPDGISIGGPMMNALSAVGQISRAALADQASSAFKTGYDRYRAIFEATPAFLWLRTSGDTRREQIEAGRAYLRMCLRASQLGLSVHPVSQALQEFPEMADVRTRMERQLGGGRVHMLSRIGYSDNVPPTPRWPLAAKLKA
jgi:hypothetical protein